MPAHHFGFSCVKKKEKKKVEAKEKREREEKGGASSWSHDYISKMNDSVMSRI